MRVCVLLPVCLCMCVQVTPHEIYLVVNAGCRDKDLAHIGAHLKAAQVRGGVQHCAVGSRGRGGHRTP